MKPGELEVLIIDAQALCNQKGIRSVERGDCVIFGRRLEYNSRANSWHDLKTDECGLLKGSLLELLAKFFPQLAPEENGGAL